MSSSAAATAAAPSARDESILTHTNLLSLHLAPVDAAAASSPSVLALQRQIAAHLPSREWFRIPMQTDPPAYISHFSLQHGVSLPQLSVRVLPNHVICDEVRARELDASLQWLMESIGVGSSYPVLGVDAESDCALDSDGEVRLLQLSTGTRCLLIRVPEQAALREVVGHAALEKQVAAASGSATPNPSPSLNPLFTPFFHSLLSNRAIFKSGAELWTDALDLWACTGTGTGMQAVINGGNTYGAEMNSCLNMSWIYRNEHGGALSLAAMVNLSLGSERCFLKDKLTTTSDWGAKQLSLRQLIYAALDAQASFVAGANQSQIPKPFHVSDMPKTWLSVAASWKQVLRAAKMTRESRANGRYDPAADAILDAASRYMAQAMQGEEPFHPFVSALLQVTFPPPATASQSMPPPNAHLISAGQHLRTPLSQSYFQGEDLAIETSNVSWWFQNAMDQQQNGQVQPAKGQEELAVVMDSSRVTVVVGSAGSGRTVSAALESLRSLQRASTIPLEHSPLDMRAAGQRVLLLTETEYGARAAAEALSKFVSAQDCMLLVGTPFLQAWDAAAADEPQLARARAMVPASDEDDRSILVCSVDYALTISAGSADATVGQWRLHHRQTVLVDDASQVWLLKLVLLLRRLPHTERMVLFGDPHAYACRWGEHSVDDVFHSALAASRGASSRAPQPFRVQRYKLNAQWRMTPHITAATSEVFYQGKLPLPLGAAGEERPRGLGWVDVHSEDAAATAVSNIWSYYLRRGLKPDQMAVMCLSEAARISLGQHASLAPRVYSPEMFQGRGCDIVFVVMPPVGAHSSVGGANEKRRLLVACSRAAQKLFLLGDRSALAASTDPADATAQQLCEFEAREVDEAFSSATAAAAAQVEETFPALANGVSSTPAAVAPPATAAAAVAASVIASKEATPAVTPAPATSASWGGGTLNFAAKTAASVATAAPAAERKEPVTAATALAASEQKAEQSKKKNGVNSKDAKSAAAAAAAAAASQQPLIEFQSAPENRAWKVLPCDKIHSVDGRRPSGVCALGPEKCGFLHNDFWVRRGVPGEFVLFTPGSKIALVEVVESWNDRRLRQMETLVDSKFNKMNRDRGAREFGHFFPEETIGEEAPTVQQQQPQQAKKQQQQQQQEKSQQQAKATAAAQQAQAAALAQEKAAAAAAAAALASSTDSPADDSSTRRTTKRAQARKKVALPEPSPTISQETGGTLQQQGEEEFLPVSRNNTSSSSSSSASRTQKRGAASESEPLAQEDDFVPVSRRHASKHPTGLAASLAAEQHQREREQEAAAAQEAESARVSASASAGSASSPAASGGNNNDAGEDGDDGYESGEEKSNSPKKSKRETAEPEPAVNYADDMPQGTWWTAEELSALSKNARKKLLWLCPACRAPNANGDARCSLCSGSKPVSTAIRYAKPPGSLGPLPREVEGKYAYESDWVKLVAPAASSTGAPMFVAAKAIPAGTIVLREDALYSEVTTAPKATLIPQPRACAQLAAQLQADPVQMALLRSRWGSSPWSDGQLKLFLRNAESASGVPSLKPKDPTLLKEWPMAMAIASTAKYAREDQEGHAMECKCHRFKLPRQSAVLVPSCWPNCAVVVLHTDPMLTADQMAILAVTDIPAGTVLTNVSDQALLNLPADRRQQTISLSRYRSTGRACHCERCSGKLAVEQEKLLLQEISGYTVDKTRMTAEYDKVMIAYSETQHSKQKIYNPKQVADAKTPVPKDGVTDSAYFALCYAFLQRAFEFLTTHPLHACHWRMQKVRELYLSLVRCDFLYRMDYMSLSGLVAPDGQHATLRQIVHVLDAAIRSDQQFFREMEPMKSLPLLTLLELCTFLIQNKVTIRPAGKTSTATGTKDGASSSGGSKSTWKVECLEFEGIGRFESQAAFLLNLSQLNQYAAIIRTLNFPYRKP